MVILPLLRDSDNVRKLEG